MQYLKQTNIILKEADICLFFCAIRCSIPLDYCGLLCHVIVKKCVLLYTEDSSFYYKFLKYKTQ